MDPLNKSGKYKPQGIATLFTKEELKKYFINFLVLIGGIEVFIFFITFLGNLGADKGPFPWKEYSLAAFITPVFMIFFLGISIFAFNKYMFEKQTIDHADPYHSIGENERDGNSGKIKSILNLMRYIPFLLCLIFLIIGAIIIYKIDVILHYAGIAGEATFKYLAIFIAVILAVAAIFGMVWLILSYKLRKNNLTYRYEYKKEVMKEMGLILIDDHTVINDKGEIVSCGNKDFIELNGSSDKELTLLPSPHEK